MSRRIARLTLDTLADLPESVRICLHWERDPVRRAEVERAGAAAGEKEAWVSTVLLEWGSCGRVLYVDENPAGFVLYAPPVYFPGSASHDHQPADGCPLPVEFLQRVGFKTHRPHPRSPRMRLDLKSVLTWREEVEAALAKILGAVRSGRPAPAAPRGATGEVSSVAAAPMAVPTAAPAARP